MTTKARLQFRWSVPRSLVADHSATCSLNISISSRPGSTSCSLYPRQLCFCWGFRRLKPPYRSSIFKYYDRLKMYACSRAQSSALWRLPFFLPILNSIDAKFQWHNLIIFFSLNFKTVEIKCLKFTADLIISYKIRFLSKKNIREIQ